MTGVVITCLIVAIALLGLALLLILPWMHTLIRVNQTLVERGIDHRACVNQVAWHVGSDFAAIVLEDAAMRWGTVEAERDRERLRREFQPGGEGVAPLWMRERAKQWQER